MAPYLDTIKQNLTELEKKSLVFNNFSQESIIESSLTCPNCGSPIHVIFSFDAEDHKETIEKNEIKLPLDVLEIHYCYTCRPWDTLPSKNGQWKIITGKTDPCYSGSQDRFTYSLTTTGSLPDWEGLDRWETDISDLICELNEDLPWELYEKICNDITSDHDISTCIGGYPQWIQSESTPTCSVCEEKMIFLGQLDYDIINTGDMSCMYIFQCQEHRDEKSFIIQSC